MTDSEFHGALLEALSAVDRPSAVFAAGDCPLTLPGLVVDGVGPVGLPLVATQAKKLIKSCHQAPYGKGTETLVDTKVRRVWELDPDSFQLTNPKWDELVQSIVEEVQHKLGLDDRVLSAHLYKLLLYEKGSFFLPHRDGEKLNGMVATLVVALPSVHEGGELIVSHDQRQHEISFGGAASGHELSYAAFYSDCQHDVRPLIRGYRLCLVYNVTLARSRAKKGIVAPSHSAAVVAISKIMREAHEAGELHKIAVALDHRYTQAGLDVNKLKGVDRARADVLFEAAEQAGCTANLALLTLWQHGAAEDEFEYRSPRRGRGRSWDRESSTVAAAEGEDGVVSEHQMGELYEVSLTADHWTDRHGKKFRLGELSFDETEVVSETEMTAGNPCREDFEGYTGNAGMTLARWYHRAAVVIWPDAKRHSILCECGMHAAVGALKVMMQRLPASRTATSEQRRQDCLSLASAIIDAWRPIVLGFGRAGESESRDEFPGLLVELDDPRLVCHFLSTVMPADASLRLPKSFPKFAKRHGWSAFEPGLKKIFAGGTEAMIRRNADTLAALCLVRDKDAERIQLCTRLSRLAVNAVLALDRGRATETRRPQKADRSDLLITLVKAMLSIDASEVLEDLIDHTLADEKTYDLTDVHLAAIFALEPVLKKKAVAQTEVVRKWTDRCRTQLEERTVRPPSEPTNFQRSSKLSCACKDCRVLSEFLASPSQAQADYSMAEARRSHLQWTIERDKCDCTCTTLRKGNPHTLVCTKTTASYDRALAIYRRDVANLARLAPLETKPT